MEDGAAYARIVVDLVYLNMEDGAANAKAVVDLACVNTEDTPPSAKTVVASGGSGLCEHGRQRSQ